MGETFNLGSQLVIGRDYPANQRMPDDIAGGELDLLRTLNTFQDPQGVIKAGTGTRRQINLGGIAGETERDPVQRIRAEGSGVGAAQSRERGLGGLLPGPGYRRENARGV